MKSVEFKSFDKVLVRNSKTEEWKCRLLDRMFCGKFLCQDGLVYKYCLPYNGNTEYLVGKSEFYEKKMEFKSERRSERWIPKKGEKYYYVNAVGWIGCFSWGESMMDNDFLEINNCFKTSKEASMMAERIKEVLKSR